MRQGSRVAHRAVRETTMKAPTCVLVLLCVPAALGHGFMVNPTARNSVDKDLPIFHNGSQPAFPLDSKGTPGCYPRHGSCGCYCGNGTTPCLSGQSCFWFSQGCTIGCPTCDGKSPRSFKDLCGLGKKATVCDPRMRTYATDKACNTDDDLYRYNPWRAPGNAPSFDPCGMAGGSPQPQYNGAEYKTTKFASMSLLSITPST